MTTALDVERCGSECIHTYEQVRRWVELELAWALTSSVEPFISPLLNEYVRRARA